MDTFRKFIKDIGGGKAKEPICKETITEFHQPIEVEVFTEEQMNNLGLPETDGSRTKREHAELEAKESERVQKLWTVGIEALETASITEIVDYFGDNIDHFTAILNKCNKFQIIALHTKLLEKPDLADIEKQKLFDINTSVLRKKIRQVAIDSIAKPSEYMAMLAELTGGNVLELKESFENPSNAETITQIANSFTEDQLSNIQQNIFTYIKSEDDPNTDSVTNKIAWILLVIVDVIRNSNGGSYDSFLSNQTYPAEQANSTDEQDNLTYNMLSSLTSEDMKLILKAIFQTEE